MNIPIAVTKRIREQLGATHLVLFASDAEGQTVATHGETVVDAEQAAKAGNKLKKALDWPADLCASKPLERICGNCSYFERRQSTFYMNSGYDDNERVYGNCMVEPKPVERAASSRACRYFEPTK